jgi:terminase large subunit-like protein
MRLTDAQLQFAGSKETFPCFCGGFGSGKTFAAVLRALSLKSQIPEDVAYYLPTYDLVRNIGFPRFAEMLEDFKVRHTLNRSEAAIHTPDYGGRILFRTMDTPERIVGYEVAHSVCDELDTLPMEKAAGVWNKVIARNRQKSRLGNTVAVATTPEGYRFVYDRWQRHPAPGYVLYRAKTMDNAEHLPAGYIDNLRNSYPPHLLAAYLDGEFVNLAAGSVYPAFDRKLNHAPVTMADNESLHVGMDFNVMNMTAIISVIRADLPVTVAELTGIRDTPAMCQALQERYPKRTITVYPDASGRGRHSVDAMQSDLTILRQSGFAVRVDPSNPSIRDRVNSVNAIVPKWKINTDDCPRLTESMEQQAYDKNGDPDKSGGLDHGPDAFGYFISQRFPIVKRTATVYRLAI